MVSRLIQAEAKWYPCRQHGVEFDSEEALREHVEREHHPLQRLKDRLKEGLPWKRAVEVEELEGLDEILGDFEKYKPGYRTNIGLLSLRDKALVSFLVLTGCRISEALKVRRSQYHPEGDPAWEIDAASIHGIIPLKQRKRKGRFRKRRPVPLPREGVLAPFTAILEEWFRQVPESESFLFPKATGAIGGVILWDQPLSRNRAHEIIYGMTGQYPHYFRAVCATFYGQTMTPFQLKEFFQWSDIRTAGIYGKGEWEKDIAKAVRAG